MRRPTSSDMLDILLAHDHWATRRLLDTCRTLPREQFHRDFPIGPAADGGLHEVIAHIIGVTGRWTDRLAGRPVRAPIYKPPPGYPPESDYRERTPDELTAILDETAADLKAVAAEARRTGLGEALTLQFHARTGPVTYTFTKGAILGHIVTHGVHHRAQCLNILKQLGVPGVFDDNPGDLSVCDWQHLTECAD